MIAPASAAPEENIRLLIGGLGIEDCFQGSVSAEDVTRGKPDPEVFLTAASRLDTLPGRCVVVEDAEAGIEAARRGGMASIGVGPGRVGAADVVSASLAVLPPVTFWRLIGTG